MPQPESIEDMLSRLMPVAFSEETRLAELGPVRAAEHVGSEFCGIISGRLGARAGREMGARGLDARLGNLSHVMLLLAESTRGVGTAWPEAAPTGWAINVK